MAETILYALIGLALISAGFLLWSLLKPWDRWED